MKLVRKREPGGLDVESLRAEMLDAQKARADYLKWKLVIVAAIGTAGLGLSTTRSAFPIVLIGIPLVCNYVDLLCWHLDLRIQVIAQFMRWSTEAARGSEGVFKQYERYVTEIASPRKAFKLEVFALRYSTWALSAGVAVYGVWLWHQTPDWLLGLLLLSFGAAGIIISIGTELIYNRRRLTILDRLPRQPDEGATPGRS